MMTGCKRSCRTWGVPRTYVNYLDAAGVIELAARHKALCRVSARSEPIRRIRALTRSDRVTAHMEGIFAELFSPESPGEQFTTSTASCVLRGLRGHRETDHEAQRNHIRPGEETM